MNIQTDFNLQQMVNTTKDKKYLRQIPAVYTPAVYTPAVVHNIQALPSLGSSDHAYVTLSCMNSNLTMAAIYMNRG